MKFYDIIDKKKRGKELSREEIEFFIKGAVDRSIPDYQIAALLMAITIKGMSFEETYNLTIAMRDSGEIVKLKEFEGAYVDKHSTGGVGDSTTFVVLPVVAALGMRAAKMSGRGLGHTGGTIDKLSAIPGMRTELSRESFEKQVEEIGLALIGQTAKIAAADKILYAIRDVTATVDSIPLIVSSIMSKKLAGGADVIVLDVKYGSGAFCKTAEVARELADNMVKVGNRAGKKVSAVLSDMNQPLDSFVGNSMEIWGAVKVLKGERNELYRVSKELASEITLLSGQASTKEEACKMVDGAISSGAAFEKFKQMVKAQGGDASVLDKKNKLIKTKCTFEIKSSSSGKIAAMDTQTLGGALTLLGGGRIKITDEIDPFVGFEMKKRLGDLVTAGETLAVMYYNNPSVLYVSDVIKNAITII
ncbi:MAG: thymidine phosphorylase [Christensenellales bacterium]|jgi:pyrimidine-nucleoside phosphorylase|nr:thymidine phosphorylase [Clostridia bacterium]HRU84381.1 thymidine phosphorylase [Eubacteriales bacterium]